MAEPAVRPLEYSCGLDPSTSSSKKSLPGPTASLLHCNEALTDPEGTVTRRKASSPEMDWTGLVERIKENETAGMEELYRILSRGVRFHLQRQLDRQDVDDKVHEIFLILIQAIRRGELRQPERLMGYIRTVVLVPSGWPDRTKRDETQPPDGLGRESRTARPALQSRAGHH